MTTRRVGVAVAALVVALAFGLRIEGYDNMRGAYWDEISYSNDGYAYLGRAPARLRPGHPEPSIDEGTWMHPPLGKWFIALGELPFGRRDIGFRLPPAVAGAAGVLLTYLLAMELWASVATAGLAALLVAVDGLHLVQSRLGMLDIFMSTLVLLGAVFVVRLRRPEVVRPSPAFHGLLERNEVRAGVAFGAAMAVKWAALP